MIFLLYAACLSVAALAVHGAFALHPVVGWVSVVIAVLCALAFAAMWLVARPDGAQQGKWW